ncbi:glycoside hydrolase superfamily [Entophlyctis helioformis]|nr:glycoside hydrolase superfamily [Entophlyctis helioformis]
MSPSSRNRICGILFWVKFTVAFLMSAGGLVFLSYKVFSMYKSPSPKAVTLNGQEGQVTIGPDGKPVVAGTAPPVPTCLASAAPRSLARLEPPNGRVLVGFHLDWAYDTPSRLTSRMGFRPAVSNAFMTMTPSETEPVNYDMLTWHMWQVYLSGGGMFELTLIPSTLNLPDASFTALSVKLKELIEKYGVPVFIRFGHEMNGNWLPYGLQPAQYITAFRKMSVAAHAQSDLIATIWAPNIGLTYPFAGAGVVTMPTLQSDPVNFALLDTNADGAINTQDDPYGPFYPGDEYVDWIGLSLYWYPTAAVGFNVLVPANYLVTSLNGAAAVPFPTINATARDFYGRFVQAKNKPFAFPESGAPWAPLEPAQPGITELDVKRSWWTQMFSPDFHAAFPNIKMVVNFEERKSDGLPQDERDWRITNDTVIASAFSTFLQQQATFTLVGNNTAFACNGGLVVV